MAVATCASVLTFERVLIHSPEAQVIVDQIMALAEKVGQIEAVVGIYAENCLPRERLGSLSIVDGRLKSNWQALCRTYKEASEESKKIGTQIQRFYPLNERGILVRIHHVFEQCFTHYQSTTALNALMLEALTSQLDNMLNNAREGSLYDDEQHLGSKRDLWKRACSDFTQVLRNLEDFPIMQRAEIYALLAKKREEARQLFALVLPGSSKETMKAWGCELPTIPAAKKSSSELGAGTGVSSGVEENEARSYQLIENCMIAAKTVKFVAIFREHPSFFVPFVGPGTPDERTLPSERCILEEGAQFQRALTALEDELLPRAPSAGAALNLKVMNVLQRAVFSYSELRYEDYVVLKKDFIEYRKQCTSLASLIREYQKFLADRQEYHLTEEEFEKERTLRRIEVDRAWGRYATLHGALYSNWEDELPVAIQESVFACHDKLLLLDGGVVTNMEGEIIRDLSKEAED